MPSWAGSLWVVALVGGAMFGSGCGDDTGSARQEAGSSVDAAIGSGGAGIGGVVGGGGVTGAGGGTSTGGRAGGGGVAGRAGATGLGGVATSGGMNAVGGHMAVTGGTVGTGGAARTGGMMGTGGSTSVGGAASAGGSTSAGGSNASGGATRTGGRGGSGPGGAGGAAEICGGLRGVACQSATDFCETPPGQCCCDIPGTCTVQPQGCTKEWQPVCGCDGKTYGNDCARRAAGVSKDHDGECETRDAGAKDSAPQPDTRREPTPIMTPTLPAACQTGADCCVAVDGCMATAYLVGKAEYAAMLASIAGHDTGGMCIPCVHPAVQVRCQAGLCVGEKLPFYAEGTPLDASHCGTINLPDAGTAAAAAPAAVSDAGSSPSVWTCGS